MSTETEKSFIQRFEQDLKRIQRPFTLKRPLAIGFEIELGDMCWLTVSKSGDGGFEVSSPEAPPLQCTRIVFTRPAFESLMRGEAAASHDLIALGEVQEARDFLNPTFDSISIRLS